MSVLDLNQTVAYKTYFIHQGERGRDLLSREREIGLRCENVDDPDLEVLLQTQTNLARY